MKFKISTIEVLSLDAPENMKEDLKKRADIVSDDDWIDLAHVKVGETVKAVGVLKDKKRMVLNWYQRVK